MQIANLKHGLKTIEDTFETFLRDHAAVFEGIGSKNKNRSRTFELDKIYDVFQIMLRNIPKESPAFQSFVNCFIKENLAEVFTPFEKVVQDLAQIQGKKAKVIVQEANFKIHLEPYQPLLSSLVHVFRNAVDHGIEQPEERLENNKSEEAQIKISFLIAKNTSDKNVLKILIADDGRGIDWQYVRDSAVSKGLVTKEHAKNLLAEQSLQLLFSSGFSTRDEVTEMSGRGVGTEAVKYEAEKLGGTVWLESEIGKGTSFYIEVPYSDEIPILQVAHKVAA